MPHKTQDSLRDDLTAPLKRAIAVLDAGDFKGQTVPELASAV